MNDSKVLVLRTCDSDLISWGEFQWPSSGPVECSDWDPTPECGHGLHGLLWGEGNGDLLNWDSDAKWLVVEVESDEIVDLRGKVKFPRGNVVYCGERDKAINLIASKAPSGSVIVGRRVTVGDYGTASAGEGGSATAGDCGTATAGNYGTATAGYRGTASAGDCGTASAGNGGTVSAGEGGMISIKWFDGNRVRLLTGYIGEDGLKPDTPYRVECEKFVEVK